MSLALKVVVLTCIISVIQVAGGISIAPGEEEGFCQTLQSIGVAPAPGYAPNVRVLMDTWNYQNLLPPHMGAVWDQVDTDTRNNASITTNVSLTISFVKQDIKSFLCSGFSNPTLFASRVSKCVALLLVLRATGY